jgi:hypothetical protein
LFCFVAWLRREFLLRFGAVLLLFAPKTQKIGYVFEYLNKAAGKFVLGTFWKNCGRIVSKRCFLVTAAVEVKLSVAFFGFFVSRYFEFLCGDGILSVKNLKVNFVVIS